MSKESSEIAAAVDQFPEHVRKLLRDSVLKLVVVYESTTLKEYQRVREKKPAAEEPPDSNVIPFLRRQA